MKGKQRAGEMVITGCKLQRAQERRGELARECVARINSGTRVAAVFLSGT
jgi:hypothetical protein